MNFDQTTYTYRRRPPGSHPSLPDATNEDLAREEVGSYGSSMFVTRPAHQMKPLLPTRQMGLASTAHQTMHAGVRPLSAQRLFPFEYFYPVPGGAFSTPLHHFQWLSPSDVPEHAAMRIAPDTTDESVIRPDPRMLYLGNVGAHFDGELAYLQPGSAEQRPLEVAGDYSSHDGASLSHVGHVLSFNIGAQASGVDGSPSQLDNGIAWRDPAGARPTRIGQQNSNFLSHRSPETLGATLPTRRGPSSSTSGSIKGDGASPSDSSNSWVYLTPTTSSPPHLPGTIRESSQEFHQREEARVPQEPRIGPSRAWTILPQKKRGRKAGGGGISKDRKKDAPSRPKQVAKRGGPLPPDVREQARITKKHGACRICHYKKARCRPLDPENPQGVCLTCKSISPNPCFRYAITDASLYRQQEAPNQMWSKRWKSMDMVDITRWESDEIRTIEVSQIFLNAPYKLKVRKFIPEDGDQMERFWYDGEIRREMPMPAYAIANLEEAADSIDQMMKVQTANYIDRTIDPVKGQGHPGLIWMTYMFAFRHVGLIEHKEEGKLLRDTLKLWIACRLTSCSEEIVGEDKLDMSGMTYINDHSSIYRDKIPVPPIMVAQQQCIVFTRFLQPLSQSVLTQLDRLIAKRKQADWLSIYLTLFLLLHSCALLTQRNAEYAQRLRLNRQFVNPDAIKAHHSGALTLLAHFHFVTGGPTPFRLAEERRLHEYRRNTSFTPDQEDFIGRSAFCISKMVNELRVARKSKDHGNLLYWVSQLYDEEWSSDSMD